MGINERKMKEVGIRRNDILLAAEEVFFQKGYEQSTMDDVARQAEFSKRTLYVYFNSKEQLYFEIMIKGYRLLIALLEERLQGNGVQTPIEELEMIAMTYYQFSCEYPHHFHAIMDYENSIYDFQKGIPDPTRDECYALGERALQFVKSALEKGEAQGVIRADLSVDQATMTLWACMLGIFSTARKKKNYLKNYHQIDAEEFIRESFRLLIRSMASDDSNRHKELKQ